MKKLVLLILSVIVGFFATLFSVIAVDWIVVGGSLTLFSVKYQPAYLSYVWGITSRIYTWTPEFTLFRLFFFLIAFLVTFGIPIAIAVCLYSVCKILFGKYREA